MFSLFIVVAVCVIVGLLAAHSARRDQEEDRQRLLDLEYARERELDKELRRKASEARSGIADGKSEPRPELSQPSTRSTGCPRCGAATSLLHGVIVCPWCGGVPLGRADLARSARLEVREPTPASVSLRLFAGAMLLSAAVALAVLVSSSQFRAWPLYWPSILLGVDALFAVQATTRRGAIACLVIGFGGIAALAGVVFMGIMIAFSKH